MRILSMRRRAEKVYLFSEVGKVSSYHSAVKEAHKLRAQGSPERLPSNPSSPVRLAD